MILPKNICNTFNKERYSTWYTLHYFQSSTEGGRKGKKGEKTKERKKEKDGQVKAVKYRKRYKVQNANNLPLKYTYCCCNI